MFVLFLLCVLLGSSFTFAEKDSGEPGMPGTELRSLSLIARHAHTVLRQKRALLELVTNNHYTEPVPGFYNATIGQHVRHSVQHFDKVLLNPNGHMADYDTRVRNDDVEGSRQVGLASIVALEAALTATDARLLEPLTVEFMGDTQGNTYSVVSTVARELSFVAHHAVHHLSMMKLMLKEQGYQVDEDVGKANSTVKSEGRDA